MNPTEVYNKETIVEMVKVMDTTIPSPSTMSAVPAKVLLATDREKVEVDEDEKRSNLGWMVHNSSRTTL